MASYGKFWREKPFVLPIVRMKSAAVILVARLRESARSSSKLGIRSDLRPIKNKRAGITDKPRASDV
jgi:hypothetical protein